MTRRALVHLVDDDEAVLRSTALLLRTLGLQAIPHASGRSFLDSDRLESGICVLLDLRMPEMSGFQVAREMRARGLDLPILLMTGHGGRSSEEEARALDIAGVLEKPFELDALKRSLAAASRASR